MDAQPPVTAANVAALPQDVATQAGAATKPFDMNSEPKNITRVRSRSSRLPVELHQALTFGDGGFGRRPLSNVLNSPDTNEYDFAHQSRDGRAGAVDPQTRQHHLPLSNQYFWSQDSDSPAAFPIKVGRSPINNNNSNNNNNSSTRNNNNENSGPCLSPAEPASPSGVSDRHRTATDLYERVRMKDTVEILESPTTTDPDLYLRNHLSDFASTESSEHNHSSASPGGGVRMIGAVQIADYEGSPRRFGASQSSQSVGVVGGHLLHNNLHLPDTPIRAEVGKSPSPVRPGFPQRVLLSATTPPEQREKCDKGKEDEEKERQALHARAAAPPFDYVYEFSETRKVLNEFFDEGEAKAKATRLQAQGDRDLMFLDVLSQDGGSVAAEEDAQILRSSKNFTLSPETTDYDSNCGDLDSFSNDLSAGLATDYGRLCAMPVLEDGLSSGHASDAESHQNREAEAPKREAEPGEPEKAEAKGGAGEQQQQQQNVNEALKEIQTAIQRVKVLSLQQQTNGLDEGRSPPRSPIWVPRLRASQESLNSDFLGKEAAGGAEDDELDTDLETDRLLGQQRLEDHFYEEDNNWLLRNKMNLKGGNASSVSSAIRHDTGSTLLPGSPTESRAEAGDEHSENGNSPQREGRSPTGSVKSPAGHGKARNKEGE